MSRPIFYPYHLVFRMKSAAHMPRPKPHYTPNRAEHLFPTVIKAEQTFAGATIEEYYANELTKSEYTEKAARLVFLGVAMYLSVLFLVGPKPLPAEFWVEQPSEEGREPGVKYAEDHSAEAAAIYAEDHHIDSQKSAAEIEMDLGVGSAQPEEEGLGDAEEPSQVGASKRLHELAAEEAFRRLRVHTFRLCNRGLLFYLALWAAMFLSYLCTTLTNYQPIDSFVLVTPPKDLGFPEW